MFNPLKPFFWSWPKPARSAQQSAQEYHSPPRKLEQTDKRRIKVEQWEKEQELREQEEADKPRRTFLVTEGGEANVVLGWFDGEMQAANANRRKVC